MKKRLADMAKVGKVLYANRKAELGILLGVVALVKQALGH